MQTIFDAILTVHACMRNKTHKGAKFPVHYSYAPQLLEWYPKCRLIHITRNPKAVYASQAAKYLKSKPGWAAKTIMRFKQFVHINLQISWTAHVHRKLLNLPNYRLIRYEDLVLAPDSEIRQLCDFLEIEFQQDMLQPKQFGSSFDSIGNKKQGIERSSLERWRTTISRPAAKTIDLLHRRACRSLGYGDD